MSRQPTADQISAADPSRSVWVTANAGTGKTGVLSDRVLRLLLTGVNPDSILCLTFTKAAAVEMTERIELTLARWAVAPDEQKLTAEIGAMTGDTPDQHLLDAARRLFARVLDLPQGLQIMTIHSFCHSLLKRFPIEAGLVPHFEVIDDRTAKELMQEAREHLLQAALSKPGDHRTALDILSRALPEQALAAFFDEILASRTRIGRVLGRYSNDDDLQKTLEDKLRADLSISPNEIIEQACADGEYDPQGLAQAASVLLTSTSSRDRNRGTAIATWLNLSASDRQRLFDDYKRGLLAFAKDDPEKMATKSLQKTNPEIMGALAREQARMVRADQALRGLIVARHSLATLTMSRFLLNAYEEAKARKGALDYDDLIERTRALLQDPDQRSWVLYKLDSRLDHILVDEAQDTSPAQWQIIAALSEEFFAGEGSRPAQRTLFVVGDEKQSIYSFQGADLENFQRVQRDILDRAFEAELPYREIELATSFRSTGAVLDIVDRVIAQPAFEASLGHRDGEIVHEAHRRNQAGLVDLWPLITAKKPDEKSEPWSLPGERRHNPSPQEDLANYIADQIRDRLQDTSPLSKTKQPPRPGDFLILVSRRGLIQELLIRALKRQGIPVAGADRLRLGDHIAVKDLIALGHAMLLPEDELNLACLLKSPLVGLGEQELFELCWNRQTRLLAQLRDAAKQQPDRFGAAARRIMAWLNDADFMPPYEFFTSVLADGGRQRLLARLGPDAAEPIEAFLEQALNYEQGHPASLQGFLHWLTLDDQQLKRDTEPARDEVRVMTVHGAKGLEAPIVILADTGPRSGRRTNRLIFDDDDWPLWRVSEDLRDPYTDQLVEREKAREANEQLRLLYVAMTRAQDCLYVAGWETRNKNSESWHKLIEQAMLEVDGVTSMPSDINPDRDAKALCYRRGQPDQSAEFTSKTTSKIATLPDWAKSAITEESQGIHLISPSNFVTDEPPSVSPLSGSSSSQSFGIDVHRLLHLLAKIEPDQRGEAIDELVGRQASTRDIATTNEMKRQVLSVLQLPDLAPVFSPGSRSEQSIIGRIGDVQIAGQIDRFTVTDKSIFLVDFKTGRPNERDHSVIPRPYLRQLGAYASLLLRIYPSRDVKAGIVWTAVPALIAIPEHHLQPFLLIENSAAHP